MLPELYALSASLSCHLKRIDASLRLAKIIRLNEAKDLYSKPRPPSEAAAWPGIYQGMAVPAPCSVSPTLEGGELLHGG